MEANQLLVRAERSETTTRQRCPQGEAEGRINPARPTNSEKSAFRRFFRFCVSKNIPYSSLNIGTTLLCSAGLSLSSFRFTPDNFRWKDCSSSHASLKAACG